ncbi:50S ribosomal protein L7/L12 [Patescibacteria group bacterium]|nr:MAG: 50S ribosomal protein L7/L12 [Patescibacteria group bacterium]
MAEEDKKKEIKTAPTSAEAESESRPESVGKEKSETEVPAKFKKIVEEIREMSVLELNELVKVFEKKFGVSASAVAVAPVAGGQVGESEEKSTVSVELTDGGANKIAVIKVVKEVLVLGLKEAKDLVDGVPSMLKTDMKKEEAAELKKKVEEAGGKVALK